MLHSKHFLRICLLVACALLALVGCRKARPIDDTTSQVVVQENASDKEIENAIIRAGAKTNWHIVPSGNKTLTGTLDNRKHQVVVTIKYNRNDYSIVYKDSINMKAKDGNIHPNYEKWVKTLDGNIRKELSLLPVK